MQSIEWRPVPGYEGFYEVSELGHVRSILRTVTSKDGRKMTFPSVTLRGGIDDSGYRRFVLTRGNRARTHKAHRLVAFAFLGQPGDGLEVCHNDGDPLNNDWRNLRWDTRRANVHDRIRHGRTYRGGSPRKIPASAHSEIIRRRSAGESFSEIAKTYGVQSATVKRVVEQTGDAHLLGRLTCLNGHPWTDANIMIIRDVVKRCRICYYESERRKLIPKPCPLCGKKVSVVRPHLRRMHRDTPTNSTTVVRL